MSNIHHATPAVAATEPTGSPSFLEQVLTALELAGRLGAETAASRHPLYNRQTILSFYIQFHVTGYVANLEFDVPPGQPDVLGTPDRSPYPTQDAAFLAGARILCHLLTGSDELPFILRGKELLMFTYRG